ncbi:MAG: NAD-dependent dehydratase [Candidatus Binatia bacterium]|nr:MAG: NAD-dependent dehydratase [Candidatus Binatia bacterium]
MRRVVVTGSRGYIGAIVVSELRALQYEVIGLDAGWFDRWAWQNRADAGRGNVDIRDVDAQMLRGAFAVVHLAALSNDPLGSLDPGLTEDINALATARLAQAALAAGVERFVLASSCSVYGAAGADWVDEGSPLRPLTPYADSKCVAERAVVGLAGGGFVPVILRFATVFGFSPSMRLDLVANNLAAWALATGEVRLQSNGRAWRPLVHVRDVARAVVASLRAPAPAVSGQVINVGSNENNFTVASLAEAVSAATDGARILVGRGAAEDHRSYRVRFDKLAALLPSAVPRVSIEQGLAEIVSKLQEKGIDEAQLTRGEFSRLHQLRCLREGGELDNRLRWKAGRSYVGSCESGVEKN